MHLFASGALTEEQLYEQFKVCVCVNAGLTNVTIEIKRGSRH